MLSIWMMTKMMSRVNLKVSLKVGLKECYRGEIKKSPRGAKTSSTLKSPGGLDLAGGCGKLSILETLHNSSMLKMMNPTLGKLL